MAPRPNSAAARDVAYHVHPFTNARKHEAEGPLIIESGDGVRVTDESGNTYLEGMAGLWCANLGFGEERLIRAAERQLRTLPYYHAFAHKTPAVTIELAERLAEMLPMAQPRILFANSGSEANDTAMKMVWYYWNARGRPEKKKILSRVKAYHGVTIASASLTGLPYAHEGFDLPMDKVVHAACPHHYRFAEPDESEEAFAERLAGELEEQILDEGPDTIGAMIGEPLMGAGGVIAPPPGYWEKVQAILKKYDILLIADEVINGFGRLGDRFGTQTYDLSPDIMTMAKGLSSAYQPISAIALSDEVYQGVADGSARHGILGHGYTYSGHPVAAAVALETLTIYDEMKPEARVRELAPRLQDGLRQYADHPLVGEVRGRGLIAAVEPVADKTTKQPFDPAGRVGGHLDQRCRAHGVILRNIKDTLAFCPPMIITDAEIDTIVDAFGKALDETHAWARAEGLMAA
jgi:4-aminobutyrate--pyruvate transaminase